MDLKDKIIVITGGAGGIGKALAVRFLAEACQQVVVVDINSQLVDATATELGCVKITADVSNNDDMKRVIDDVERNIGPIDLFCSNAGVGAAPSLDSPDSEWQLSWDVNVMSHMYAARHLVPRMVERGHGYFLITASAAGLLNQIGGAAYGTTKHAAIGFGEWLALTYAHKGIGVSMLCPQAVRTAMTANADPSVAAASVDGMMEPADLAEVVVEGLREEGFLILPHLEVLDYMRIKSSDYDRWIAGMNRLHQKFIG